MKHKVSELEGVLLDAAVAQAQGDAFQIREVLSADYRLRSARCLIADYSHEPNRRMGDFSRLWEPSRRWEQGRPIIEREGINFTSSGPASPMLWSASLPVERDRKDSPVHWRFGPTALIAAMRAYVFSKFGQEVELP